MRPVYFVVSVTILLLALCGMADVASADCEIQNESIECYGVNGGVRLSWSLNVNSPCSEPHVYIYRRFCESGGWTLVESNATSPWIDDPLFYPSECNVEYRLDLTCTCGEEQGSDSATLGPIRCPE